VISHHSTRKQVYGEIFITYGVHFSIRGLNEVVAFRSNLAVFRRVRIIAENDY